MLKKKRNHFFFFCRKFFTQTQVTYSLITHTHTQFISTGAEVEED